MKTFSFEQHVVVDISAWGEEEVVMLMEDTSMETLSNTLKPSLAQVEPQPKITRGQEAVKGDHCYIFTHIHLLLAALGARMLDLVVLWSDTIWMFVVLKSTK